MNRIQKLLGTFSVVLLVAASASTAMANTAANTRITNSADLSYNDGTGLKHAISSVTVTVALKPATPTIIAMASQTGPYPTPLVDDYTLTNNANGPDTFILTTATNTPVNTTSVTAAPGVPGPGTPITLGATVTASGSTVTDLIVPSDGVSDISVNGIKLGAKVVVNGEERTVTGITDNPLGTSVIQVAALSSAPGPGVVIGERKTVHATVTPNNITTAGQNVTVNVTMTATSSDASFSATSGDVGNLFYSGSATLTKFVRNVTTANGSGGSTTTLGGVTYYNNPASLTAKPGDVLEYLLLAANSSATAAVTSVVLTDLVPVDYVTMVPNAYGGTKPFRYIADSAFPATFLDLTAADTDDAATYDATFDTTANAAKGKITAWVGGAAPLYNIPGTIAASKSVILLYQVTVKP